MGLPLRIWLMSIKNKSEAYWILHTVCTSGFTKVESLELERFQKSLLYIAHGENYYSYYEALKIVNLEFLIARWIPLCTH